MNVIVRYRNGDKRAFRRLGLGQHTIGRDEHCVIQLDDPDISRCHLRIDVQQDEVAIGDLDSANGTWRKGRQVEHLRLPRWPVRLRLGPSSVIVLWASPVRTIVRMAHAGAALAVCAMFIFALAYSPTERTTKRTCGSSIDMETRLRRAAATGEAERAQLLARLCRNPQRR